jgi:hypothetical protein
MEVREIRWTERNIIDLIRKLRNDLIKDFLDERYLKEYVLNRYNVKELSSVRIEFIKQKLKQLLIAPVDTVHYLTLIKLIGESDTASLSDGNEQLFYSEIETVLKTYLF